MQNAKMVKYNWFDIPTTFKFTMEKIKTVRDLLNKIIAITMRTVLVL